MADEDQEIDEVAEAIRELAAQVDALGNAVYSGAEVIARAITDLAASD
jgi:outer membrane murein-binding lipoprotein Lpp